MPDVVQLGRKVKAKYPGVYDDLPDGVVGQRVKAKYPGAYDDFTDIPSQPFVQPPILQQSKQEAFTSGMAEKAGEYIVEPALSFANAVGHAAAGDFGPLGNMAEAAGRGLLKTATGIVG